MTPNAPVDPIEEELYSSWALLIQIILLCYRYIMDKFYYLHSKEIRIINETVLSIFAGKAESNVLRVNCNNK